MPIKQSLAVTGSVNQFGQVQAIGGVNEKIEGFFDLCKARGLTGDQGVLIPEANVKHLMLRQDVVDAVAAGQFAVYPVDDDRRGHRGADGRAGRRARRRGPVSHRHGQPSGRRPAGGACGEEQGLCGEKPHLDGGAAVGLQTAAPEGAEGRSA